MSYRACLLYKLCTMISILYIISSLCLSSPGPVVWVDIWPRAQTGVSTFQQYSLPLPQGQGRIYPRRRHDEIGTSVLQIMFAIWHDSRLFFPYPKRNVYEVKFLRSEYPIFALNSLAKWEKFTAPSRESVQDQSATQFSNPILSHSPLLIPHRFKFLNVYACIFPFSHVLMIFGNEKIDFLYFELSSKGYLSVMTLGKSADTSPPPPE